jgi:hypothetical protein
MAAASVLIFNIGVFLFFGCKIFSRRNPLASEMTDGAADL